MYASVFRACDTLHDHRVSHKAEISRMNYVDSVS